MSVSFSDTNVRAQWATDLVALMGTVPGYYFRIYDGTPPADVDTADTNTALVVFDPGVFGDLFLVQSTYSFDLKTNPTDIVATATGIATHWRLTDLFDVDIFQGTVSATGGGGDLELTTTSITTGDTIRITQFTITMPP